MNKFYQDILVCPECKSSITENDDSQLICPTHEVVGEVKFGIYDFLFDREFLTAAANGKFDLTEDEKIARKIVRQFPDFDFRQLQQLLVRKEIDESPENPIKARAVERFNENYAKMDSEIGLDAGHSIMNKVNPHLAENGLEPLGGKYVLEAGGGHGLHLPAFAEHFETVVFADCSLVNLIMGKKLAEETNIGERVLLVRADATALPFKNKTFDFVHESGVIEHVEEPQKLVSEALRVLSDRGNYVCLSPNKYPLSPEPHFRLPLFGAFPRRLRKYIIQATRGTDSEEGTDLLSLKQLKNEFRNAGEKNVQVYFLPRKLSETTRNTFVRRFIHSSFQMPVVGAVINFILNKALLPVMPYHIVVVSRNVRKSALVPLFFFI